MHHAIRAACAAISIAFILAGCGGGGGSGDPVAPPSIPAHAAPVQSTVAMMTVGSGDPDPDADTVEIPVVSDQIVVLHAAMDDAAYAAFRTRLEAACGTIAGWDRESGWIVLTTRTGLTIAGGIAAIQGDPGVLSASANIVFTVGEPIIAAPAAVPAGLDVYALPYDTPSATFAMNHDWNGQTALDTLETNVPGRVLRPIGVMDDTLVDQGDMGYAASIVPDDVLGLSNAIDDDPDPAHPDTHAYDVIGIICGRRDQTADKWLRGMLPTGSAVFTRSPRDPVGADDADLRVVNRIGTATYLDLISRFGLLSRKRDADGRTARVFNLSFGLSPLLTEQAPINTRPSDGDIANSMLNKRPPRAPADAREASILGLALQHSRAVAGGIAIMAKERGSLVVIAQGNWPWNGDTQLLPDPFLMGGSETLYAAIASAYASNVIMVSDPADGRTHGVGVTDLAANGCFVRASGQIGRGSSFAAPAVAAIAEATWSAIEALPAAPRPTPTSVKGLLVSTAVAGAGGIPVVSPSAIVSALDAWRPVNHVPTSADLTFEIFAPDVTYEIDIRYVDVDGDPVTFHIDHGPSYGTATVGTNGVVLAPPERAGTYGTIWYTQSGPVPDGVTGDRITFHITDGRGRSTDHVLTIPFIGDDDGDGGMETVVVPVGNKTLDGSIDDWAAVGSSHFVHDDGSGPDFPDPPSAGLDVTDIGVAQGLLVDAGGTPRAGTNHLFMNVRTASPIAGIVMDDGVEIGAGLSVFIRYGTDQQGQDGVAIYEISYEKREGRLHAQFQHRPAVGDTVTESLDNTYVKQASGEEIEIAIPMAWLGALAGTPFRVYVLSHAATYAGEDGVFDHVGEDNLYVLE